MTLFLKNYLKMLNDTGINNKDNMIMNIGLLLEKNISKDNPTDYSLLLPPELVNLSVSHEDIDEIINSLLILLKNKPSYSSRIVWAVGKTFDERKIEALLFTLSQIKYCDDETFKQITFLTDVVKNKQINRLVYEIELFRSP